MKKLLVAACAAFSFSTPASAGIPVIDAASIAQAITQVQHMLTQIEELRGQLETSRRQFDSLNGIRGMAGLINDPDARRYLPANAQDLYRLYEGGASGRYSGLSGSIEALKRSNKVLQGSTRADAGAMLDTNRSQIALMQASAEAAYQAADDRFASYQELIERLNTADDPKSVYELQARIQAEQVMMQNEQTKLQMMNQLLAAQRVAAAQKARETTSRMGGGSTVYASGIAPSP